MLSGAQVRSIWRRMHFLTFQGFRFHFDTSDTCAPQLCNNIDPIIKISLSSYYNSDSLWNLVSEHRCQNHQNLETKLAEKLWQLWHQFYVWKYIFVTQLIFLWKGDKYKHVSGNRPKQELKRVNSKQVFAAQYLEKTDTGHFWQTVPFGFLLSSLYFEYIHKSLFKNKYHQGISHFL